MGRDILIALYIKYQGDWDKMFNDIKNKVMFDHKTYLAGVDTKNYVTILDQDYPDELRHINKPPFVYDKTKLRRH